MASMKETKIFMRSNHSISPKNVQVWSCWRSSSYIVAISSGTRWGGVLERGEGRGGFRMVFWWVLPFAVGTFYMFYNFTASKSFGKKVIPNGMEGGKRFVWKVWGATGVPQVFGAVEVLVGCLALHR